MDPLIPSRAVLADVAMQLQQQTDVPAWVVASSNTLMAIASGRAEIYGPRGRWFYRLFNRLGVNMTAQFALQLVGSIVVTIWWLQCIGIPRSVSNAKTLFIGFGASSEKQMLENFRAEVGSEVTHIDQTKPCSWCSVARPSLTLLWKKCASEANTVVRGLRTSRNVLIQGNARQWLISAAIRFSDYVFIKTWAETLPLQLNHLTFIAADIPAFALLDANNSDKRRIEYRQHGLHKISIVFPPFKYIRSINRSEALHMMRRLPAAEVSVVQNLQLAQVLQHTASILFVSPYDSGSFRKQNYIEVIKLISLWTINHELRLIVRLHPNGGNEFWIDQFSNLPRTDIATAFDSALLQLKPRFVIGWWSTALLDALKAGVLPILIMSGSESALEDMVFPLAEIALKWPGDIDLIKALANDPELYHKELTARQVAAFGTAG